MIAIIKLRHVADAVIGEERAKREQEVVGEPILELSLVLQSRVRSIALHEAPRGILLDLALAGPLRIRAFGEAEDVLGVDAGLAALAPWTSEAVASFAALATLTPWADQTGSASFAALP